MNSKTKGFSDEKINLFRSKLGSVDSYIRLSEGLPDTVFMHPQLLELKYAQKPVYEIKNKLKIREFKTIIFKDFNTANFQFDYAPLAKSHCYLIRFTPEKTTLSIKLTFDEQRKKFYEITKEQAIVLKEPDWKKLQILIKSKRVNSLCLVKVEIDTMKVDFKTKNSNAVPPQKKIVEKELDQYLKVNLNKNKIQEIIQKRKSKSLSRLSSMRSTQLTPYRGTLLSRTGSMSAQRFPSADLMTPVVQFGLNSQKIKSAQEKRDWIQFQESKQKYFKHFEKMSPEKAVMLKENQKQYDMEKRGNLKQFTKIIFMIKFFKLMNNAGIEISKQKVKNMRVNLMCKKFSKKLFQANKMKISYRNRNRAAPELNLNAIACFLHEKSVHKSKNRIFECFQNVMFKQDVAKATEKSEYFIQQVIKIQRFLSGKRKKYMERFTILAEVLRGRIFESQEEKNICLREYIEACKKHDMNLKIGFFAHHKELDKILYTYRSSATD